MAFEGALLALAQVLNLRGYVVEVNVFQSPFTNGGGINERPSVVVAFIQRLREFGLIGRLRFRLAHAVNLSPRHSQPQLTSQDKLYQPRLRYREGSRQVVSLDKKLAPFHPTEMILLHGDASGLSPPPRSWIAL